MSRPLAVTEHAVERFLERWRPFLPYDMAREELEGLAARAVATRRLTVKKDARIYLASAPYGEVALAVREATVVTVLAPEHRDETLPVEPPTDPALDAWLGDDVDGPVEPPSADSMAPAPLQSAEVASPEPPSVHLDAASVERGRRENAARTLAAYEAGTGVTLAAARRACKVLGVELPRAGSAPGDGFLTITGGRWDGVRVQLRDGDGLNAIVGRLLAAMRTGTGRRSA